MAHKGSRQSDDKTAVDVFFARCRYAGDTYGHARWRAVHTQFEGEGGRYADNAEQDKTHLSQLKILLD